MLSTLCDGASGGFFWESREVSVQATSSYKAYQNGQHTKIMFLYIVPYSQNLSLIFIPQAYKKLFKVRKITL